MRYACLVLVAIALACSCQRAGPAPDRAEPRTTALPNDSIAEADSPAAAAQVIRAYYHAIDEPRYQDAYRLWESEGAASRQTFDAFRAGFDSTASVKVSLGTPGPIGAAAGSRYIEIPIRIDAVTTQGAHQAFEGTYTLRRSEVDGATAEQRAWRIYSAKIRRAER